MIKKKIIIIDDERQMTHLLKIELDADGYDVSVASSGEEGLRMIKELKPDLILLDVMMPGMDGYEVLKALKEDEATKNILVIMLTAKGLEHEIQKGLDMGVDDYISKPFHSGLLLKRIKTILKITDKK